MGKSVECYREQLDKRIDGIARLIDIIHMSDPAGKVTDEELNAMRSGALAALGYVHGMLGGLGAEVAEGTKHYTDIDAALRILGTSADVYAKKIEMQG